MWDNEEVARHHKDMEQLPLSPKFRILGFPDDKERVGDLESGRLVSLFWGTLISFTPFYL